MSQSFGKIFFLQINPMDLVPLGTINHDVKLSFSNFAGF